MKNLFVLLFLGFSQLLSSQEVFEIKETTVSVQTLKIHCESAKDLKEINWDDIRDIIENNEPNQEVALEFGIHNKGKKKEAVKSSFNFKIKGKSKDILNIVKKAQKGVRSLIKLSDKI